MRRQRWWTVAVAVVLVAAACSSSAKTGTSTRPPVHGRVDVGAPAAPERCDPLDSRSCLLPFPSDTFTLADPSTPTRKRIHLDAESMPANKDGVHIDPRAWNRNDGFSPGQPIMVHVGGLDLARSRIATLDDIGASLRKDAPIVLLDATTGRRWPYWAELDHADDVLTIRPARNYPESHRMVVALRGLHDDRGRPLPVPSAFVAYRDRRATNVPAMEARRARYERVFGDLARVGLRRADLYLAWDFTIASAQSIAGPMLHIRDDAFRVLGDRAPTFAVTNVEDHPAEHVGRRVSGTFDVPLYLTGTGEPGARFVEGPDGLPQRNGDAVFHASLLCIVPDAALAAPGRAVVYGHGLLGSNDEVNASNVRLMADEHDMVYCATNWIGLSEDDVGNAASILTDLSRFPTLADRAEQGMLDALFLARLMRHAQGLVTNPAFQSRGRPVIDVAKGVFYDGNSQGGIMGGALTAVSTEFTRAVLGVPAMNYSTLLERSSDWPRYRAIFEPSYPRYLDRSLGISLIQMLWDRAEANGYAEHMTDDPYPGTPRHTVLIHVALGDWQVANGATEVEARTIGARLRCPATAPGRSNEHVPHWGLTCIDRFPYAGSVIVWWDSGTPAAPLDAVAPHDGRDPHEDPRADPAARRQKSEFLAPDGRVFDVCDAGAPCRASPTD